MPAPLRPRILSLLYEAVLLVAILFVASYLFLSFARDAQTGFMRIIFQGYLVAVCGAYFAYCWARSGQTLPMKTWRLRVLTRDGSPVSPTRAVCRYLIAIPGILTGIGLAWALIDRERQFLHDRLAGTMIVRTNGEQLSVNS